MSKIFLYCMITINSNYFFFSVEDFPQPMNTRKYNEAK